MTKSQHGHVSLGVIVEIVHLNAADICELLAKQDGKGAGDGNEEVNGADSRSGLEIHHALYGCNRKTVLEKGIA